MYVIALNVETDTDFDVKRKIWKYIGVWRCRGNIATRRQKRRAQDIVAGMGEGGAQRYSAADRNIRRYLRILGVRWQDIGTGEPTTPRYIEGTKHRGSGRRTRIEILLEYSCVFLRVSDFYGDRGVSWITRGKPHGFACSWPAALTVGAKSDPLFGDG